MKAHPWFSARLLCWMLALGVVAAPANAAPVSEIVLDAGSGETLFSSQASRVRPPASLTKMMTLLLTFEAISSGELRSGDKVVMTRRGARQPPSKLGLQAGRSRAHRKCAA